MGTINFIYADNGSDVFGGNGHLYLTDAFSKAVNLPSPFHFVESESSELYPDPKYGLETHPDVFAIYAVMMYLAKEKNKKNKQPEDEVYQTYIECFRKRDFQNSDFKVASLTLRRYGFNCYYEYFQYTPGIYIDVPALGKQQAKHIKCNHTFIGQIPILISKKELPEPDGKTDLLSVAKNWGYVSKEIERFTLSPLVNCYCIFHPNDSESHK